MLENKVIRGVGASPGIVVGNAFIFERERLVIPKRNVREEQIQREVRRFEEAVRRASAELRKIKEEVPDDEVRRHAFIIDAYTMILNDRFFLDSVIETIRERRVNTEWALDIVVERFAEAFEKIDDPYLSERGKDIRYIGERLLRTLVGERDLRVEIRSVRGRVIVVAHDLSPTDTIQLDLRKVAGFVTDIGGRTSHTSIVARALDIPAVVGTGEITAHAKNLERLIVDGDEGIVIVNPSEGVVKEYLTREKELRAKNREYLRIARLKPETKDGFKVKIGANIELPEEVDVAARYGASGIGLYRTEYLYLSRKDLPSEEDHFHIYRRVVGKAGLEYVTIRTLDLGGDKFASHIELPKEMNPALGLRAIRLCIKEVSIFKSQLFGILRASVYGPVRILLPMVSGVDEVRRAKEVLKECMEELEKKGVEFRRDIEIGAMIEIPSACMISDKLAEEVDFFSIGTNDLIQYALAIDRVNESVSYLYEPLHPAVLRLIRETVENGHRRKIEVGLCGEMAGEPLYVPVLLGLEIDELSMNPHAIPKVKKIIRGLDQSWCREILQEVMDKESGREAEYFLRREMGRRFPDEFIRCYEE